MSLPSLTIVAADVVATAPVASAGSSAATFNFVTSGTSSTCSGGNSSAGQNYSNWVSSSVAPAGTVAVDFTLTGGGGAGGDDRNNGSTGGAGGRASVQSGRFPASAGQYLWAKLGCGGRNGPPSWAYNAAGWALGGASRDYYGGGGGGASILCQGTSSGCTSGTDVVRAVAGGGGGGGRSANDGCTPVYAGGPGGSGTTGSDVTVAGGTGRSGVAGGTTQSNGEVPTGGGGGGGNNTGGAAGNDLWKSNVGTAGGTTTLSNGFVPTTGGGNGGRGSWGYDDTNAGGGGGGLAGGGGGGGGDTGDGCGNLHAGGAGGGSGSSWFDDSVSNRTWGVASSTVTNACDNANPFTGLSSSTAGYGATAGYSGCPGYVTATWITSVAPAGSAQTTASAVKGTALPISLANTDADSDTRTCSVVSSPTKGNVTLSGASPSTNCTASYTASANTTGNDSFTYKVTDQWSMDSSTYTVTVPIGNRKPVGTAATQTIQRGTTSVFNLAASDPDNDTINGTVANTGRALVSTSSMPSGSSTSCTAAGACTVSIAANTTPGDYSFTWKVSDLVEASDNVTQTVTVANTAPTASTLTVNDVQRGRPAAEKAFSLAGSDPANGDTLSYAVASTAGMPAGSTVSCATSGACSIGVPSNTALGNYSFTYTASDGAATSSPATVTVGVGNTAPVANPVGAITTTVGEAKAVTLNGTDFNGDTLTYNAPIAAPSKGAVTGSGAGRTYTAANGTKGADSFTYTVSDNGPSTSTAGTVSIFIANTAPVANAQAVEVTAPAAKTFQLTGSDVNADGLTFAVQTTPSKGDLSCNAAGACTYTPHPGAVGEDAVDFVANDGTTNSAEATITFDVIPPAPTIDGSRSPLANGNGWNNEPVTVSFSCHSDALTACTAPVTLSGDGAGQSVTGTVTDSLDRTASTTVSNINIDQVVPTLMGLASTAPNAAGWYKAPVTMNWTCGDALSGIAPGACPGSSATVGEGTAVSASASVVDKAGNQTTATSETVKVDQTAPSTGVSSPPTWSKEDVTLLLSAADALSGVAKTEYQIDGGPTQTGADPVVSGQGVHTVSYWSTDVAANVEVPQQVTVRIDTDAPSITGERSPAPNSHGWNRTDVDVAFTCTDSGGSGVASCSPTQSFTGEVDTTATGTVADHAGNTASEQVPVRIDRTVPAVTAQVPAPNASGWFNAPVQVPFSCVDDGGSGVAMCPAPVMFAGEGADQAVSATATDLAGNEGSTDGTSRVSIDLTAPEITGAVVEAGNGNGGYFGTVHVHFTCGDALSGVVSCPADQTVSGEGVHVVSASVADRAGNVDTAEVTVRIDHDTSQDPGAIHGTLTNQQTGDPAPGVQIGLFKASTGAQVATTTTGTDGTWIFPVVADGSYKLAATKWGTYLQRWYPATSDIAYGTAITVAKGTDFTADMAISPGHVIKGSITASSGGPIAGATMLLSNGTQTKTDATGAYEIKGIANVSYTYRMIAVGYVTGTGSFAVPNTTMTTTLINKQLAAQPASMAGIKGTITSSAPGGALAGATVRIYAKDGMSPAITVTSGADGRFQLPNLPAGDYQVDVVRGDYAVRWAADAATRAGAATITLTTSCTSTPDASWGAACATPVDIRMRKPGQ